MSSSPRLEKSMSIPSPYRAHNHPGSSDGYEDGADSVLHQLGVRGHPRSNSQPQQPPLIPKYPSAGHSQHPQSGFARQSMPNNSMQTMSSNSYNAPSSLMSGAHGVETFDQTRWSAPKPGSSVSSSSSSLSPVGPVPSQNNPRTMASVISLQNILQQGDYELILSGDEKAILEAAQQVELFRNQYEHADKLTALFGFDEQVFRFLAHHYIMFDTEDNEMSFRQMCARNALTAFVSGNAEISQTWRMLDLLFESETEAQQQKIAAANKQKLFYEINKLGGSTALANVPNQLLEVPAQANDEAGIGSKADDNKDDEDTAADGDVSSGQFEQTMKLLERLDQANPQAMQGFDPYPYDAKGRNATSSSRSVGQSRQFSANDETAGKQASPVIQHGNAVRGELRHLRDSVVKDLVEYYVDVGDLQTSVAIAMVAQKVCDITQVIGKSRLQQIIMHYIDMLHQMQIYSTANFLITNCNDSSIRQMNMKSTTVYFNCAKCSKPLDSPQFQPNQAPSPAATVCSECSSQATRCSVCQLPVRGLYVWCSVCSHGGHFEHLKAWFEHETTCPTGCSHNCSLSVLSDHMTNSS